MNDREIVGYQSPSQSAIIRTARGATMWRFPGGGSWPATVTNHTVAADSMWKLARMGGGRLMVFTLSLLLPMPLQQNTTSKPLQKESILHAYGVFQFQI